MAAAIRDAGDVDPESPEPGTCGLPGKGTLCRLDLEDAPRNEA